MATFGAFMEGAIYAHDSGMKSITQKCAHECIG